MKIVNVRQNTDEWLGARAGILTASELDNIVTPKFEARTGKGPETYLFQKLAERCMGAPLQTGSSYSMEQGSILEAEAREALPWLAFTHDVKIERVGFVTTDDGMMGCSPDGLIGDDGGVELKCPRLDTHLKYFMHGGIPADYLAQVHGSMYVTGRPWWYFVSYTRCFAPIVIRVERDEKIQALIGEAVTAFNAKLADAYAKMKALARDEDQRPLPPYRQFRALIF